MKTYTFKVSLEPDEEGWRVFFAPWENLGASTWGKTKEEALKHIQEVLSMIIEEFIEEGGQIPENKMMEISEDTLVTISV